MMIMEVEDIILRSRFLNDIGTGNETLVSTVDSQIVAATLRTYGSMYLILIVLFCILRVKFPRLFNTRSWAPSVKCDLAQVHFGAIDWFWKVWLVSDDDFREQCGMDALSFVRIYRFGLKVSLVGIFNSLWLMPVFATSPVTGENRHITDPLVMITVGYVPSGDPRLVATVIAAYIQFGAVMFFLLKEFEWFTSNRHKYLSALEPRNYTVYVSHIPAEYRTSARLADYFRSCFSPDAVLEAHVALDIPQLEKLCAIREKVVNKLERAITIEEVKGRTPSHRSSLTSSEKVNSINAYSEDLRELNDEVRLLITEIEEKNDPISYKEDLEAEGGSLRFDPRTFAYVDSEALNSEQSSLTDLEPEKVKFEPTLQGIEEELAMASQLANSEEEYQQLKRSLTGSVISSVKAKTKHVANNVKSTTQNVAHNVKSTTQTVAKNVKSTTQNVASAGLALILRSDDGKPREAGFVTFTNLKTTQSALQQIHSEKPFVFEVAEAPQPEDIFWINVGRNHKSLQIGKLMSFALTAVLCLFWTIPITFIVSLTSVESLKRTLPFLGEWMKAWPALELFLAQLAPLILIMIKSLLPVILGIFSALEGPISSSVLEASLFYKLAIFEIVQTFFVSAISGSILGEISNILQDPSSAVTLLATSIPGQSAFYMQIIFVQTFLGQGLELLRVTPLAIAGIRKFVGPRLTEKERDTTFAGLRPLSDPQEFEFADIVSNGMLYFMVMFVYGPMAPVTNWFLAFCYVIMISGYRHQLIFNYPNYPDSGGQLWIGFISIAQTGMLMGQVTLFGYLALKKATIAVPFMVPLIVMTVLFNYYIRQRHFVVTQRLPSRAALKRDLQNQENGPLDMSFVRREYLQQALQSKEDAWPENYGVAREIASEQIAFMTPPGSEADIAEVDLLNLTADLDVNGVPSSQSVI